jgi:hypothetical protein
VPLGRYQRANLTNAEDTVAVVRFSAANAEAAETLLAALQTTALRGANADAAETLLAAVQTPPYAAPTRTPRRHCWPLYKPPPRAALRRKSHNPPTVSRVCEICSAIAGGSHNRRPPPTSIVALRRYQRANRTNAEDMVAVVLFAAPTRTPGRHG